jgi:hypothetical protein
MRRRETEKWRGSERHYNFYWWMIDILLVLKVSRQFSLVLLLKVGDKTESIGKCSEDGWLSSGL